MLPDIGGTEILLIAIVALIVVGPKDLPALLRKIGGFMSKLRGMAADFRSSFDDMARQSELEDLRKQVEAMRHGEFAAVSGEAKAAVDEIERDLSGMGVDLNPPPYQSYEYVPPAEPEPAKPARKPRAKPAAAKVKIAQAPAAKTAAKPAPKAAKAAPKKAVTRAKTPKAAG